MVKSLLVVAQLVAISGIANALPAASAVSSSQMQTSASAQNLAIYDPCGLWDQNGTSVAKSIHQSLTKRSPKNTNEVVVVPFCEIQSNGSYAMTLHMAQHQNSKDNLSQPVIYPAAANVTINKGDSGNTIDSKIHKAIIDLQHAPKNG